MMTAYLSDCDARSANSRMVDEATPGTSGDRHPSVSSTPRAANRRKKRARSKLPLKLLNCKVQESDQKFFESFSALPFKIQNAKKQLLNSKPTKQADKDNIRRISVKLEEMSKISKHETDELYVEVLYTIRHTVGAATGGVQLTAFEDDPLVYAQEAFRVDHANHQSHSRKATLEKPPKVLLNVCVMEARNLLSKDANGFSDPFCMLGVVPGKRRNEGALMSRKESKSRLDDIRNGTHSQQRTIPEATETEPNRPRVMTLLAGSFRRKTRYKGLPERKPDTATNNQTTIPASIIKATSVQRVTLNPEWNEKFTLMIEDVKKDRFHLDIWDNDDETNVVDAVRKLNEVKGVKGLGQFFKQVAQSARSGNDESVDDFLGCVSLNLKDIPSTGIESWFPLEGRSSKSEVKGDIKLKLWFGTREERYSEDNQLDVHQHEEIIRQFAKHELGRSGKDPSTWTGRLPQAALTILHQHALQGDLTDIQCSMCYWLAYSKVHLEMNLDYTFLYEVLDRLLSKWRPSALSKEEETLVSESFLVFLDHCYDSIAKHRDMFPVDDQHRGVAKLNDLLRCVVLLHSSSLFRNCLPFQRKLSIEIPSLIQISTTTHFEQAQRNFEKENHVNKSLSDCSRLSYLVTVANAACTTAGSVYHDIFWGTTDIDYFSIMYREYDRLLTACLHNCDPAVLQQNNLQDIFELHLAINEFFSYSAKLTAKDSQKCTAVAYTSIFDKPISKWITLAKEKAFLRVDQACRLDKKINIEGTNIQQSSSYVDVCFTLQQMLDFWDRIVVADVAKKARYCERLTQTVCEVAKYYVDTIFGHLTNSGLYQNQIRKIPESSLIKFCSTLNNAEQLRRLVSDLYDKTHFGELAQKLGDCDKSLGVSIECLVYSCDTCIVTQMDGACNKLTERQRETFKRHIFHLAWSPEGCYVETAMQPLIEQLDKDLITFHRYLLHRNFIRLLLAQMVAILDLIQTCIDENPGLEPFFYRRLNDSVSVLRDFFHAGGKGLPMEAIDDVDAYRKLKLRLSSKQTSSVELIERFYCDLLQTQTEATECKYGIINVRAYYNKHSRSMIVDVIGAKKVLALDRNGLSDPFVIVELVPRVHFKLCNPVKTRICHKTLNPTFDETFEFKIDPVLPSVAMLHLVVMDHDFLVTNDFAGEAFLDLAEVPGIGHAVNMTSSEGHGELLSALRQFNLILQHNNQYDDTIIGELSARKEDPDAQAFVKHVTTVRNL